MTCASSYKTSDYEGIKQLKIYANVEFQSNLLAKFTSHGLAWWKIFPNMSLPKSGSRYGHTYSQWAPKNVHLNFFILFHIFPPI
jgi:hypothetical protein